ncbi:hypothetical protein ACLOAU_06595 [Niabella sp. CJ426]|uniref:hypothetical protein n=1 Tax=Niabella sp. CJ426 TaxID=3393740 RepID=UPI003D08A651
MKNNENKKVGKQPSPVRDYGNDPYFVKKANKSKAFLEKHGFPSDLMKARSNSHLPQ